MFVILLSYTKPIELIDKLRPAHLAFLDRYFDKGIFLLSGRQNPVTGGVIIANANSTAELEAIIQEDPFYTEDVAKFDIIEFTPSRAAGVLKGIVGL